MIQLEKSATVAVMEPLKPISFLRALAVLAAGVVLCAGFTLTARAGMLDRLLGPKDKLYTLSFYNMHTHATMDITYRDGEVLDSTALRQIDVFLGDYRTGGVHKMDIALIDLLHTLKTTIEEDNPGLKVRFNVFSGYRSAATNTALRRAGGSQAEKSLHIEGKAIDINVPGVSLADLRNAAWCLHRGGVGYYPSDNFVHVDTGKKRYWGWDPVTGHARCRDSYLVNQ